MRKRPPRLELDEVVDSVGLAELAAAVRDDRAGMAEFGGFYGAAPVKLGPLLSEDRRAWLIRIAGACVGFVDADLDGGRVDLGYFVVAEHRRQGVARSAVGRVLGLAPWGDEVRYTIAGSPGNMASIGVARSTGFQRVGRNEHREEVWERAAPRRRSARNDPTRFLGADGRIDRYPATASQRRTLLAWVTARAIAPDEVLTEAAVNERLAPFSDDVAALRRHLVDGGFIERTRSGSEYARVVSGS